MDPSLFDLHPSEAVFRELRVDPEEAKSVLRPQKDPVYGFNFSLNPYRGCSHGCRYCYVRGYPAPDPRSGPGALHDPGAWGGWIAPKINAPELLWAQRHRLHGQAVFVSSATDPYQPIEREYRLTRRCLEVLLRCPTTRVIVHTRAPLVLQDLELLKAFEGRLSVGFSIPTDDDTVRQVVEPEAPAIPSRWAAVERLARAGLRVGISASPLMPIRDLPAFVKKARESGVQGAWAGGLRLLPQDPFYGLLRDQGWTHVLDPDYVASVKEALRGGFPALPGARLPPRGLRAPAPPRPRPVLPPLLLPV